MIWFGIGTPSLKNSDQVHLELFILVSVTIFRILWQDWLICLFIKAEYKENKKRYAIKIESALSDYALVPYEANVTLIMHGIDKREKFMQGHVEESVTKEGFAKVFSLG